MKKQNSVKRSLIASVLVLCLCFTALAGTTFAWFTDSAVTGSNVITAGNLDIDVQYTLDGQSWNELKNAKDLFQKGLWEPGHTEVVALKITNAGDLALKYAANLKVLSETKGKTENGDDIVLSELLVVSTLVGGENDVKTAFDNEDAVAYTNTALLKDSSILRDDVQMATGEEHYLIVKVDMPATIGNEANHDGVSVPKIDLGIEVIAIQLNSEEDTFGKDYDADLDPVTSYMFSGADIHNSTTQSGIFGLSEGIKTSESTARYGYGYEYIIRNGADYTLDLNGQTIIHDTVNKNANNNALTYLFVANHAGTKLTIDGEGTIYSHNSEGYTCAVQGKDGTLVTINGGDFQVDNGIAVWAGAGAHMIINDGSFVNGNATTDHELIYSSGGVIDIYGGFFHNTDGNYTLNVEDRNRATSFINVYGGTYVNFDPSTGGQDPNNIRVADGYMVTSETQENGDVWYTVVPVPEGYTAASTANEVTDALAAGENIVLTKDIEFTEALTIDGDVDIDLNGKKMSTVGLNFTGDVTIKNGTVASGGHTNMVPHLKVSSGTLAMTDVTVDVNHHLNANVYWAEATGMEVENATAVLNNCNIKINNQTGARWVYSYGISLNNANLTVNGGSITATCVDGTDANGPTNPNAISAMGESIVTLNNVDVSAIYYATTVNGHLTINTTDTSVTSADVVDNRGGSHTLNYID